MAGNLARYHGRSPRYILDAEDDSLIRIAGPQQIPWEEGTQIQNISLTGLSFTAPDDLSPILGEVIKIQFRLPTGKQIASHSIVTRLEHRKRNHLVLVGVHFYKMDTLTRVNLAKSLIYKLKNSDSSFINADSRHSLKKFFAMSLSLWMWVAMMLIMLK